MHVFAQAETRHNIDHQPALHTPPLPSARRFERTPIDQTPSHDQEKKHTFKNFSKNQ
jgi:hypothetical protein